MTDRELLMYALGEMKHFCVLDRAVRKIEAALASERAKQEEPVPFNAPGKAHVEAMLGSAALPAVQGEPEATIIVAGPTGCGKSAVMELIYKALRDANLHPYSDDIAHERRMVNDQPLPSEKVWKLVESSSAPSAVQVEPVAMTWPKGLRDRLKAAHERFINGHAPRRIPADPTDADLVLAEVRNLLDGNEPPFWVAGLPREPLYAAPPADDEAVRLLQQARFADTLNKGERIALRKAIDAYLARAK